MLLLFGDVVIRRYPTSIVITALMLIGASLAGCDREKQADGQALEQTTKTSPATGPDSKGFAYVIQRGFRGQDAPDVAFADSNGKAVRLADFRGKPILLNLWATWCAPCVAEMPALEELAKNSGDKRHIVTVSQDYQGSTVVTPWMEKAGLTALPAYVDPENRLMDKFNSALPTTIYYDAKGKEVWRVIGAMDWMGAEAAALLAEAS
jgi:thiol-disulfide isomerase/thioredoxin